MYGCSDDIIVVVMGVFVVVVVVVVVPSILSSLNKYSHSAEATFIFAVVQ